MIWVISGTSDSYEIIRELQKNIIGPEKQKENPIKSNAEGIFKTNEAGIIASVVTEYGYSRLTDMNIKLIKKELNKSDMRDLIKKYKIDLIIDASHPFARNVSENAITVCRELNIRYIRYEREELDLSIYPAEYIFAVYGYQEAVEKSRQFEKIFLAIGSNNLSYFTEGISKWENRLIARILPDGKFLKKAEQLGFIPANLLAMQGPFSRKLNKVLLEEYGADVLVSKASGTAGGLDTKIRAALDINIPVIIIKRPKIYYPLVFNDINRLIGFI